MANLVFGIVLLVLSVLLVLRHLYFWRSLDSEQRDLVYFRRQRRRRVVTSVCIGVAGLAIASAAQVRSPMLMVLFLAGLILLVCWILMMALLDYWSTRSFLYETRRRQLDQRRELEREVERLRKVIDTEGNGKHA